MRSDPLAPAGHPPAGAGSAAGGVPGRWWVLALLTLVTVLNFFDRQLPFIMLEPIKAEFQLSDAQVGTLGGLGFSLVYALMAIPLARLADRRSRVRLLAGCIAVWSVFTALAGAARSFPQLMITRIGVAVGEAGSQPATHSLISDLFPVHERGRAISIASSGIYLGLLLGMAVGGILLEHFAWRTVLMFAAVPGIALTLVFLVLVKEPPRRGPLADVQPPPILPSITVLWRQRTIVWLTIGAALSVFASSGSATFGASFLIRVHGYSLAEAGLLIGIVIGAGGMLGALSSGWLADRLILRDRRWVLWLPAWACALKLPIFIAVWWVPDPIAAGALLFASFTLGGVILPLCYTATQSVSVPRMRAFASASTQLFINLIGNVLGPIFVGLLSDWFAPSMGSASLSGALTVAGLVFSLCALAFWRAARFYRADLAAAGAVGNNA